MKTNIKNNEKDGITDSTPTIIKIKRRDANNKNKKIFKGFLFKCNYITSIISILILKLN